MSDRLMRTFAPVLPIEGNGRAAGREGQPNAFSALTQHRYSRRAALVLCGILPLVAANNHGFHTWSFELGEQWVSLPDRSRLARGRFFCRKDQNEFLRLYEKTAEGQEREIVITANERKLEGAGWPIFVRRGDHGTIEYRE